MGKKKVGRPTIERERREKFGFSMTPTFYSRVCEAAEWREMSGPSEYLRQAALEKMDRERRKREREASPIGGGPETVR